LRGTPAHRTRLDPPTARAGRCPGRPIEERRRGDRTFAGEVCDREVPDRTGEMAEATAERTSPAPDSVEPCPPLAKYAGNLRAVWATVRVDRRRRPRGAGPRSTGLSRQLPPLPSRDSRRVEPARWRG